MSAFLLMTALYPAFISGEKVVKTVVLAGKQMILSTWLILVLRIGRNWISANHLPLTKKTNIFFSDYSLYSSPFASPPCPTLHRQHHRSISISCSLLPLAASPSLFTTSLCRSLPVSVPLGFELPDLTYHVHKRLLQQSVWHYQLHCSLQGFAEWCR